jgi:hypothetical protein
MNAFPFIAQWSQPVTERYEFLTDVLVSENGTEQRIALRDAPRYTLEATVQAKAAAARLLETTLRRAYGEPWLFPLWFDARPVPVAGRLAGSTSLTVDTTHTLFSTASVLLFWCSPSDYQVVNLTSYSTSTLHFSPLARAITSAWRVYPLVEGQLLEAAELRQITDDLVSVTLQVKCDRAPSVAAVDQNPFRQRPTRAEPPTLTLSPGHYLLDYQVGRRASRPRHPLEPVKTFTWILPSGAAIHDFRGWIHARRGRQVEYWQPSSQSDYQLLATATAGSDTLLVGRCGQAETFPGLTPIMILRRDRGTVTLTVKGATVLDAEREELLLLESLAATLRPADLLQISRLQVARLDSDVIELVHRCQGLAKVTLPVRWLA